MNEEQCHWKTEPESEGYGQSGVYHCQTRVGDREGWRSIATDLHCGDNTWFKDDCTSTDTALVTPTQTCSYRISLRTFVPGYRPELAADWRWCGLCCDNHPALALEHRTESEDSDRNINNMDMGNVVCGGLCLLQHEGTVCVCLCHILLH